MKNNTISIARDRSLNAIKHQIFVSPVVLRNENNESFLKLEREYTEHWAPVGPSERKLVEEMAVSQWRQQRVWSTETAGIDLQMDKDAAEIEKQFNRIDEPVRVAIAMKNLADNSNFLELMHRYETRFSRQYDRALRRLLDLQDRRKGDGEPVEKSPRKPSRDIVEPSRDIVEPSRDRKGAEERKGADLPQPKNAILQNEIAAPSTPNERSAQSSATARTGHQSRHQPDSGICAGGPGPRKLAAHPHQEQVSSAHSACSDPSATAKS